MVAFEVIIRDGFSPIPDTGEGGALRRIKRPTLFREPIEQEPLHLGLLRRADELLAEFAALSGVKSDSQAPTS
jgi:hypothetical protein